MSHPVQKYRTATFRKRHSMPKDLKKYWDSNKSRLTEFQRKVLDLFYWRQKTTSQIAETLKCTNGNISLARRRAEEVLRTGLPSRLYRRKNFPFNLTREQLAQRTAINEDLNRQILQLRFKDLHTTVQIAKETGVPQMAVSVICNLAKHAS